MGWNERYKDNNTPWDLGRHSKTLEYLQTNYPLNPQSKGLVLGSGRGHDAHYLSQYISHITAVDLSELATQYAIDNYSANNIQFITQDIFTLPEEYNNSFDYIFEHTCFCALDPSQRAEYVELAHRLLKPNGKLYGIFWFHTMDGGPPYSTTEQELQELFSSKFHFELLEPTPEEYIERNLEHVCVLRKKIN